MKENLKKFLEEASKNEELKAKLAAITDKDTAAAKAIELANEYGITLTAEDFEPDEGDKLSLDELENAAGGAFDVKKIGDLLGAFGEFLNTMGGDIKKLTSIADSLKSDTDK
ncbi:MAG: Nif11-like leader peptide family RiPP precursor [Ruminiclostridium sp.]|nr:Nif11-like leader peptide family RiPP precursor [Ruminiclostridium sp.]MBP3856228.1 Nif11-like leader peptide family RiPP precursor [Ruminiclostridium sp.]